MGKGSRTGPVTTKYEKTLRMNVAKMEKDLTYEVGKELEKTQQGVEKSGRADVDIDDIFDTVDQKFRRQSDAMREEVKSDMPKKPTSNDPKKQAEHDEEVKNYVSSVKHILSRLTDFITDVFVKIKEFFRKLWDWIKKKVQGIAKKVGEFIKYMKEKFCGLVDYIFG